MPRMPAGRSGRRAGKFQGLPGSRAFIACLALLGGCAANPETGRLQVASSPSVTAVYSEITMQLSLVSVEDREPGATGDAIAFEQRVARVGARLARAAFERYPAVRERVGQFQIIVVDKAEPGTMSSSTGRIAILRPVADLAPEDAALAFILAREIGHVVADHHAENTATGLALSGLAYVVFPLGGIVKLLGSLFAPAGTAAGASTSLSASSAATAASWVGTQIVVQSYRPQQREEADAIALELLGRLSYDAAAVAQAFTAVKLKVGEEGWVSELAESVERIAKASTATQR